MVVPIIIADDRSTLSCSITYCEWKIDRLEELFNLLIECSASDDNLIEFSTKSLIYLSSNLLPYLTRNERRKTMMTKMRRLKSLLSSPFLIIFSITKGTAIMMIGLMSERACATTAGEGMRVR